MTRILDKTDKGREEIATRRHGLSARMRPLLLLIDGKHDEEELLRKVAGLGLSIRHLEELIASGFIQEPAPPEPGNSDPATKILLPGETQLEALAEFCSSVIKGKIGLRGYPLQARVDRAQSVADFIELRKPLLLALVAATDAPTARSLREQFDTLLYLGHPPAELEPIAQ